MPLRILQKIRSQVRTLAGILEAFADESVQPTVAECEKLQQQMHELLEHLAVYKFHTIDRELSPTFGLHARISGAQPPAETPVTPQPPPEPETRKRAEPSPLRAETNRSAKPLSIGINDKFRFINELFAQNVSEYHIAVEQLGNLKHWHEAELYLGSLKNLYDWKDNSEPVKLLYSLVKRRFA
jgi:hypothetical protein